MTGGKVAAIVAAGVVAVDLVWLMVSWNEPIRHPWQLKLILFNAHVVGFAPTWVPLALVAFGVWWWLKKRPRE